MPKKMLNPNTTLWAIDAALVPDIKAITAADLNTVATNISCAITRGYTLNPTDSDTDDTASICDSGNVENRLYDNYEGEFTAFRDAIVTDATSIFNKVYEMFKAPDRLVYIVRRLGKRNTMVAVDTDELEAFLFINDNLRSMDGGDDGPIQFTVPLLAQGTMTGYFYLGGSAPIGAKPTITAATPASAATAATVTLTGTNFTGASAVTVGGVAGNTIIVTNATTMSFKMPTGAAGSAPIVVSGPGGSSTAYAYTRAA